MPADMNNTQYEMAPVSEISEQIKELQFISKHLQEQLTGVNTKLDILLQRALDMASISTTNSLVCDNQCHHRRGTSSHARVLNLQRCCDEESY